MPCLMLPVLDGVKKDGFLNVANIILSGTIDDIDCDSNEGVCNDQTDAEGVQETCFIDNCCP